MDKYIQALYNKSLEKNTKKKFYKKWLKAIKLLGYKAANQILNIIYI